MDNTPEPVGCNRIADSLSWQCATRADLHVARLVHKGEEPDAVYPMAAATLVDGFLAWLDRIGVLARLKALRGEGVRRQVIPFRQFVYLYFLRCLALLFGRRVKRPQVGAAATVDALFERLRSAQNGP